MSRFVRIFVGIIFCSIPLIAQVSKSEKKIVKSVDSNNVDAIVLLKEVVNINSGSMNFKGVREVADMLFPKFEQLGFETRWVDGASFNRAGHLVAFHQGSGSGPRILLIGHLDTVFEPDNPFQEYSVPNDSILHGPGVVDMKGGDVIIIYALQALKDAGLLDKMTIEVIFTGDEEKSGSPIELSKKAIVEAAKRADIALGFENGDSNFSTAVISRRGSTSWELHVTGNAAHSSQIFSEKVGAGAIYEASRILNQFYERLSSEEFLTFNPGVMLAGTQVEYNSSKDGGSAFGKSNVVAKSAIVRGDLRAVSLDQLHRAKKMMNEVVSEALPETSASLVFSGSGYPPLAPDKGNKQLLIVYDKVSRDLGFGAVTAVAPINAGAADISFTSGYVKMAMDGLGLSGGNDHTINEYGELNKLAPLTKRAAVLIYRLDKEYSQMISPR